jgi:hypothetical protein
MLLECKSLCSRTTQHFQSVFYHSISLCVFWLLPNLLYCGLLGFEAIFIFILFYFFVPIYQLLCSTCFRVLTVFLESCVFLLGGLWHFLILLKFEIHKNLDCFAFVVTENYMLTAGIVHNLEDLEEQNVWHIYWYVLIWLIYFLKLLNVELHVSLYLLCLSVPPKPGISMFIFLQN